MTWALGCRWKLGWRALQCQTLFCGVVLGRRRDARRGQFGMMAGGRKEVILRADGCDLLHWRMLSVEEIVVRLGSHGFTSR